MNKHTWMGLICLGLTATACTAKVEGGGTGGNDPGGGGSTGSTPTTTTTTSSTSGSSSSGTTCTGRVPANHRPTAVTCAPSTPATACSSDTDCTMPGPVGDTLQGKCNAGSCDYNQCAQDSDCATAGDVCSCQGQTREYAGASPGSLCIPANCRTDADCGSGGYCSPTVDPSCGSFYGTEGWYCHTCQDTCIEDTDCGDGQPGSPYCAYDPTVGHWACGSGFCAG